MAEFSSERHRSGGTSLSRTRLGTGLCVQVDFSLILDRECCAMWCSYCYKYLAGPLKSVIYASMYNVGYAGHMSTTMQECEHYCTSVLYVNLGNPLTFSTHCINGRTCARLLTDQVYLSSCPMHPPWQLVLSADSHHLELLGSPSTLGDCIDV